MRGQRKYSKYIEAESSRCLCIGKFPLGAEVWAVDDTIFHGRVVAYTRTEVPRSIVFAWNGRHDSSYACFPDSLVFASVEEAIAVLMTRYG